jgi:hypothetical protein
MFMLGAFCLEPFLDKAIELTGGRKKVIDALDRTLWLATIASLLATLVNPYGIKLYTSALQYANDTKIYDIIVEFHAMNFRTLNDWSVLLLLMLACFAMGRARRFRPVWALLLGWSAWMGFRSLREVWLVTILSVAVISMPRDEEDEQSREPIPRTNLSLRLAVGAAVALILLTGASVWSLSSKALLKQVADHFPLGSVAYIREHHLPGPLLNELSWGGFIIYALPEIPPAMDGRTNVHSQDSILNAIPLWDGAHGWQDRPELKTANLVLSNHDWALALLLRSDPRFRIVYEDKTSVLFERVAFTPNSPAAGQTP